MKYQKSEMPVHSAIVGAAARVSHEPQPDAWLHQHGPVFALALLATWIYIIALTIWRKRPLRPAKIKRGPMPFGGYDADPAAVTIGITSHQIVHGLLATRLELKPENK